MTHPEGRGVSEGLPLRIRKNQYILGVYLGMHLGVHLGVNLGMYLGGCQGKLEFAPGDSQAFHYWEVHAPSTC